MGIFFLALANLVSLRRAPLPSTVGQLVNRLDGAWDSLLARARTVDAVGLMMWGARGCGSQVYYWWGF